MGRLIVAILIAASFTLIFYVAMEAERHNPMLGDLPTKITAAIYTVVSIIYILLSIMSWRRSDGESLGEAGEIYLEGARGRCGHEGEGHRG